MVNFLSSMGVELLPVWALWLIAAVVFGIIEAMTMGLGTIWFAGGALAAAAVSFATDSLLIQLLIFILVSLVLLYFTRPVAAKKLNRDTVKTNIDAIIGAVGSAESDITKHANGTVKADNKIWTAVLAEDSPDVSAGDRITVLSVEGVKLIVRKEN